MRLCCHLVGSSSVTHCIWYKNTNPPGDIRIKGGHLRVELLVALDEGVLVDFPDLAVIVPRPQVVLQVGGVGLHPRVDLVLYLLDLFIAADDVLNWLKMQGF